jgi:hypothetical protein
MTPTPSIAQGLKIGDLLRRPGLSPHDAEDGDRSHRSVRQVIPDPTP